MGAGLAGLRRWGGGGGAVVRTLAASAPHQPQPTSCLESGEAKCQEREATGHSPGLRGEGSMWPPPEVGGGGGMLVEQVAGEDWGRWVPRSEASFHSCLDSCLSQSHSALTSKPRTSLLPPPRPHPVGSSPASPTWTRHRLHPGGLFPLGPQGALVNTRDGLWPSLLLRAQLAPTLDWFPLAAVANAHNTRVSSQVLESESALGLPGLRCQLAARL